MGVQFYYRSSQESASRINYGKFSLIISAYFHICLYDSARTSTYFHSSKAWSIFVQCIFPLVRKSRICCSWIEGKQKNVLFIQQSVEIRERKKEKDTFHATFLISLKKTNNSENVALSKFDSSLRALLILMTFCCITNFLLIELVPIGATKSGQLVENGTFVQVPD